MERGREREVEVERLLAALEQYRHLSTALQLNQFSIRLLSQHSRNPLYDTCCGKARLINTQLVRLLSSFA